MSESTLEEFERAGIAGLVRAGEAKDWFSGHFGAALIAGTRLLREPDLSGPAALALSRRLRDYADPHRDWLAPLDDKASTMNLGIDPLLAVLRRDASTIRTSGHPTIYMANALHVLTRQPALATDRVIEGLILLHEAARQDDPRRYYGIPDYFEAVERGSDDVSEPHGGSAEAFRSAMDAIGHLVPDQEIDGRHYFLAGEKIHLLTHAHAVATLEGLGWTQIAAGARRAQADLERLLLPSRSLPAAVVVPAQCTPFDAAFWEQVCADSFHLVKLAEAVVAEILRLRESERGPALDRMRTMWALLGIH